jgi:hypothetical protein
MTPLTRRDRQILEHVARQRLTTQQVLRHLFFPGRAVNAAIKVTQRLCQSELLERVPVLHRRCYFVLTVKGAKSLGVSAKRTGPLGVQALPIEYAALHYSCLADPHRRRLTAVELKSAFPWMEPAWTQAPHCVLATPSAAPGLELLRVAYRAQADHIARKCRRDIQRRSDRREFQELVQAGRFRLVVIVATAEGAAAIRTALDAHAWPDGLEIRLAVLTQLAPLLGGVRHDP